MPGWNCNRRASNPRAWIRLNVRRSTKKVVGCCPVAFLCLCWRCICCIRNYSAACNRARRALPSFISAVLIGMAIMAASALASHHDIGVPLSKLFLLLKQFLLYFTVTFVLEEVAFRGALDSHIYQPPTDGQRRGGSAWLSAIFVSALWGIWHLPLLPTGGVAAFAAAIPLLIMTGAGA